MLGVDRAVPFTRAEYAALRRALGWPFVVGFYLKAPRSGGRWTQQDVDNAELWVPAHAKRLGQSYPLLPFYVGKNLPWDAASSFTEQAGVDDGNDALVQMQSWGIQGVVCLDVEGQTPNGTAMPYVQGWTHAVEAGDAIAAVYGTDSFCRACAALDNTATVWKISAHYISTGSIPATPALDPTFQDGQQFANEVTVVGVGPFDLDTYCPEFPFATLALA